MIARLAVELGPWTWWVIGLVLLAAEILMPGVFLVWIGIAALITGVASLLLWETGFWVWEVQFLVFAVLAIVAAVAGRRLIKRGDHLTDQPFLNQRGASLVGRTAILEQPITEGRGRIRLNDTTWSVEGPDLPQGARVRVTASAGPRLIVESA